MYLGLDFGTSGARACVLDHSGAIKHEDRYAYHDPDSQTAENWRTALHHLLHNLPAGIRSKLKRIAIDATSGTVLLCDAKLQPVSEALIYHDARASEQATALKQVAPQGHTVCSATSGLAKFLWLTQHANLEHAYFFLHQADWLTALLTGIGGISDYHNALKTGYDPENLCWPEWVKKLPHSRLLPQVSAPGELIATINPAIAQHFQLNENCAVHAGTTDSIASFIAADAHQAGAAVTSLGSTIVLKLLSDKRIENVHYGVYSHRFGNLWLAGGASNAGGSILKKFFTDAKLAELSSKINTHNNSPLDYYPLSKPGERFPVNDPLLAPRLTPRPDDDTAFLHGILQGLSRIEMAGYQKLQELGATPLNSVTTCGGGAKNTVWQNMRERMLQVPVTQALHSEASYGAARLAMQAGIISSR